jgi:hypothetical protein
MPNTWSDPYANTTANPYPTKKGANASEQVLGLYQSNFGRSASSPEIEGWVNYAGGGSYLSPDQLTKIQTQFTKEPEYASYTGTRPSLGMGDYIPGVTLGTMLDQDSAWRPPTTGGGLKLAGDATSSILMPSPLPGTTGAETALNNTGPAEDETTTIGMQSQIRDALINMLNAKAPTAQDPSLAPAISAFGAAQNKATARQVNQNAEAFGAAGLESSGARLGADRAAIEQQGLNESQFASNAVLGQLQDQRQQAMQALQTAVALNDQDLSRRLQERLGQLNATIQRESLALTGSLGQQDIDQRGTLGRGQLNLNLLGLMQQGQQYNTSMGFNVAQLEAALNNQAVRTALGI